jgi:predicted RNA-binding Zn-ribbon protein involved in translation (DUF1610 family)
VTELADIFRTYGPAYRAKFGDKIPPSHLQAMRAIEQCRTPALGGHVYTCPDCGETLYRYHSCRNRHCPKCQHANAQRWLEQQYELQLPAPYFILTFTLPSQLRPFARSHQKLVYATLFRISAEATQQLARDPRFIGGTLGLVGVLHTWARDLSYHPHVHYLIPAGGLAQDGQTWLSARKNFLLPVKALSRLFRAKFRDALRKTEGFADIPASVWEQDWVVHCKPVGDGRTALKYLAPYIFRVALSNRRIIKVENDQVTFSYRASGSDETQVCTLPAEKFIHRFLQHVLPKSFVKVRYYGLFSPALRQPLSALRPQLGARPAAPAQTSAVDSKTPPDSSSSPSPSSRNVRCPACGHVMQLQATLPPLGRAPP